jgi:hypothetical protein
MADPTSPAASGSSELVLVLVGKRSVKNPAATDGSKIKRNVYSLMKKDTATYIGVPAAALKSGVTEQVTINHGPAKGATYDRSISGARSVPYTLHYPNDAVTAGNGKKGYKKIRVSFPAGTGGKVVAAFLKTLTKKPAKFTTPSGQTHYIS